MLDRNRSSLRLVLAIEPRHPTRAESPAQWPARTNSKQALTASRNTSSCQISLSRVWKQPVTQCCQQWGPAASRPPSNECRIPHSTSSATHRTPMNPRTGNCHTNINPQITINRQWCSSLLSMDLSCRSLSLPLKDGTRLQRIGAAADGSIRTIERVASS